MNIVPEGLILLVSLTSAVSAVKMARRGVLAQQLNAIESLASVDVICTDKTGTLTEATLRVVELVPADGDRRGRRWRGRSARFAASAPSRNATLEAIADAALAGDDAARAAAQVPFSSRRRWSALELDGERLVLGAPERFAARRPGLRRARASEAAGRRVLALAAPSAAARRRRRTRRCPAALRPLGLVVLAEQLRAERRARRSRSSPPRTSR